MESTFQSAEDLVQLSRQSLARCEALFRELEAPTSLIGIYRAEITGPAWVRLSAPASLALCGFAGWCGKEFFDDDSGNNLAVRNGKLVRIKPMYIREQESVVDGKPVIALHYPEDSALGGIMVDEFRQYSDGQILALSFIDMPGIPKRGLPFVLTQMDGEEELVESELA